MGCFLCKTSPKKKKKKGAEVQHKFEENKEEEEELSDKKAEKRQRDKSRKSIELLPDSDPQLIHHSLKTQQGWPQWLSQVAGKAIKGWVPRRVDTFQKLDKIGQGTYSNVYKAKDLVSGKIVALKKVRFDNLEADSVKFMAREILILRRLDHPNVIKLEGIVTSRMSSSIYLVFEYMEHDLAGLVGAGNKFTESQVKCYMKQILSGLEHCHNRGVLHRDIKGSNLLLNNEGVLKIADFGLASFFDRDRVHPMTNRVVTLWYRPPELLLGATYYDVGVDLWSAGCILGEMLAGKPILSGRTEVEQLHKIFKLCGSPSEEYWKKSKLPHASIFKPPQPYKRCIQETFKEFPPSSRPLIEVLLAIEPGERGTATSALESEFFTTKPYPCEPSSLPVYPPSKEMDVKLREEEARRQRGLSGKDGADGAKRTRLRASKAIPAPEANAELQVNVDHQRWRLVSQANTKCKSEKFPPPHQDGAVGYPLDTSQNTGRPFAVPDMSFTSSIFEPKSSMISNSSSLRNPTTFEGSRTKQNKESLMISSRTFARAFNPSSFGISMDLRFKGKRSVSEVFGG